MFSTSSLLHKSCRVQRQLQWLAALTGAAHHLLKRAGNLWKAMQCNLTDAKQHEPLQWAMCDMQATALCNTIHYCTPPHQKYISSVKKHNITQCTLCTEMIVKSIISPRSAAVPDLTQRRLSFKQRSYSPSAVRNLYVKLMFVSALVQKCIEV